MERIQTKIERYIRTGEGDFDLLALELFRFQYDQNKPYQAWCRSQNASPDNIRQWHDIPAVPMQAFKSSELTTFPAAQASAIFESSGTTAREPSRHYLKDLRYYEQSLKISFEKWMQPFKAPFLILTPPPAEAPRSSLSWMMDVVKRKWGASESAYFIRNGRLDDLALAASLERAQNTLQPVALLGTTLAFLAFFDICVRSRKRFKLPSGSRLMDTGGMKGQKRECSRPDFVRQVGDILGIGEDHCVNEYGMCEMSSQFYGCGASTELTGPAWVRTLVDEQTGVLTHFDLANVDSVMAIETEDVGQHSPKGFMLLGRSSLADQKGCSLSAEAYLA